MGIHTDSIIIFDRGYYSEDMFRYCVEHGYFCVLRLKECLNLSKKCSSDTISVLPGSKKEGTSDLSIRVIEVVLDDGSREYLATNLFDPAITKTSVYKGYKQDKIEMRGDRAEMSDFPLYLNTVAGGLDRRDQTIGGFSFVVKIYAVPVVEIIG